MQVTPFHSIGKMVAKLHLRKLICLEQHAVEQSIQGILITAIRPKVKGHFQQEALCLDFKKQNGFGLGSFFYHTALPFSKAEAKLLGILLDTGANLQKMEQVEEILANHSKTSKARRTRTLNKMKSKSSSGQNWKRKHLRKDSGKSRRCKGRVTDEINGMKGVSAFQIGQSQPMQVYAGVQSHFQLGLSTRNLFQMAQNLPATSNEFSVSASVLFYILPTQTS